MLSSIAKIVGFLAILLLGYYFFFLKPQQETAAKIKTLSKYHSNLVQNRIAYVELTRLDPKDPNAKSQKDNLLSIIASTQKESLGFNEPKIRQIYERQAKIIEKLKNSKTFEEGVNLLKGQESVANLADQTNLILEFEFQLERLKAKR